MTHFIIVREEAPDRFVAHPCGIPELEVTAPTRSAAVLDVRTKLIEWVRGGNLVLVNVSAFPADLEPPRRPTHEDEDLHRDFVEELALQRRLDDEREGVWKVEPGDDKGRREVIDTIRYRHEKLRDTLWDYEIPWPPGTDSPEDRSLRELVESHHREKKERALARRAAEGRDVSDSATQ